LMCSCRKAAGINGEDYHEPRDYLGVPQWSIARRDYAKLWAAVKSKRGRKK